MTADLSSPEGSAGRIFQINVSKGGVPKLAIPEAELGFMGVAGDAQRNLESHGGLERAVILFSLELILALQAEGHQIYPGALGENLTVVGLDWSRVVPESRLRLGEGLLLEIIRYTPPCTNIAHVFIGGDYSRVSQKRFPGWSRVSARILQPGALRVGSPVVLLQLN
jgi:MOSC domain-containing protein YiiM